MLKEENFLDIIIGNFYDCICNSVYTLQQYVNTLYNFIPNNYTDNADNNNNERLVLNFIANEHENIVKYKGIAFANDISNLLQRKYNSMIVMLAEHGKGLKFTISNDACDFLTKFQDRIIEIEFERYAEKTDETLQENSNIIEFMNSEFEKYKAYKFNNLDSNCSNEDVINVVKNAYAKLSVSMTQLRLSCANSTSGYYTILTCRKIVSLMIILYHILSTIQIDED